MMDMEKMRTLFLIIVASYLHFVGSSQLEIKNTEGGLNNVARSSNEGVLVPSVLLKDGNHPSNSFKLPDGADIIKKNYDKLSTYVEAEEKLSHLIKMTTFLPNTEPDGETDPKLKGYSKESVINISDNSDKLNDKTTIHNKDKINNEARVKKIQNKYEATTELFHYKDSTIEGIRSKDKTNDEARNEQIDENETSDLERTEPIYSKDTINEATGELIHNKDNSDNKARIEPIHSENKINDEASIEPSDDADNRTDGTSMEPIDSKEKNKAIPITLTPREIIVITDLTKHGNKKEAIITPSAFENNTDIHRITRRAFHYQGKHCGRSKLAGRKMSSSSSSSSSNSSLSGRNSKCQIPSHLAHSEMRCIEYPQYTRCKQTCSRGYTLGDGDSQKRKTMHKCKVKKDKWHPYKAVPDCIPEVSCDIKLHHGKAKCFYNSMKHRPYCHIKCDAKDREEEVEHLEKYKCSKHPHGGPKWHPKLPKCAEAVHG